MIEREVRSFITKEKYDELATFFRKHAVFMGEEEQETYYFDAPEDLRTQRNNTSAKLWMKKGTMHDDAREEIEIFFHKEDFESVNNLLQLAGHPITIQWWRKRHMFEWDGVTVCLDHTRGYGYIIELELMATEENKESIVQRLRAILKQLEIIETPKEEFNKAFDHYKQYWRTLL